MNSQNKDILELLGVVFLGVSFWSMSFGSNAVQEITEIGRFPVSRGQVVGTGQSLTAQSPLYCEAYDRKMRALANLPEVPETTESVDSVAVEPSASMSAPAKPAPAAVEPVASAPTTITPAPAPAKPAPVAGTSATTTVSAAAIDPAPATAVDPPPAAPVVSPPVVAAEPTPAWPVQAAYPNEGAILPFERIVAYYGNFYSRGMGVLGEYDEPTVISKLQKEIAAWEEADPDTPVRPGIDYIAIVAQASAGKDGMYRARMPADQVQKAIDLAAKVNGIVILEVQAGFSKVFTEVKSLEDYLVLPQVHLAIDPEFAMERIGVRPGLAVGTVSAAEVNEVIDYLAELVQVMNLPPKVLIVHRYTKAMVTNATDIKPRPEVQVVMDMDGWGPPYQKYSTYNAYIAPYPVQFTGFKLFYKNDTKTGTPLLKPDQVLELVPKPIFIQYQ